MLENQFLLAIIVFVGTYALIVTEVIHRSVSALTGAILVLFLGLLSFTSAIGYVDWNTLGLLIGMMIIVTITRRTGVFEYVALSAAIKVKGDGYKLLIALSFITAVASAFLDNVTAVLLMVPVTFALCDELELPPMPFLITMIIACNVGGTATLIGDPPNIMIGSATGLTFNQFLFNLAPIAIVIFTTVILLLGFMYRKQLVVKPELQQKIMQLKPEEELKDRALLKKCLIVLALTISGFALHGTLGLQTAVIAMGGAVLLMVITKEEPEEVLLGVEWPTIFFFAGLFVVVGALQENGVIKAIAEYGITVTGGDVFTTGLLVLWLSAIASAFVDNIPFVATMIPLLQEMGQMGGIENLNPLWWSLALGACLGGNGTLVGAAANVIVAGLSEKRGVPISFMSFLKIGFPVMILSIIMANIYLVLFIL